MNIPLRSIKVERRLRDRRPLPRSRYANLLTTINDSQESTKQRRSNLDAIALFSSFYVIALLHMARHAIVRIIVIIYAR